MLPIFLHGSMAGHEKSGALRDHIAKLDIALRVCMPQISKALHELQYIILFTNKHKDTHT